MSTLPRWLIAISNLVIAIAISIYIFGRSSHDPATPTAESPVASVQLDLTPLLAPIESLDESLSGFTETLQRFNTTLVQYDFLQKEIERMANLDQIIANRLNLELQNKEQLGEAADATVDETIDQITQFQQQVQQELEQRRQMMMQLIAGLEQELAKSNVDEKAVREVIGDTPPAPDANTTLPPFPAPVEE